MYYYILFNFNKYWIEEKIIKTNFLRNLKFSLVNKIRFFMTLGYHIFENARYWTRMNMP